MLAAGFGLRRGGPIFGPPRSPECLRAGTHLLGLLLSRRHIPGQKYGEKG
jgi:hypothetical protein